MKRLSTPFILFMSSALLACATNERESQIQSETVNSEEFESVVVDANSKDMRGTLTFAQEGANFGFLITSGPHVQWGVDLADNGLEAVGRELVAAQVEVVVRGVVAFDAQAEMMLLTATNLVRYQRRADAPLDVHCSQVSEEFSERYMIANFPNGIANAVGIMSARGECAVTVRFGSDEDLATYVQDRASQGQEPHFAELTDAQGNPIRIDIIRRVGDMAHAIAMIGVSN